MHGLTRRRLDWLAVHSQSFLDIWENEELTCQERVDELNNKAIPTTGNKVGTWAADNAYRVHRMIRLNRKEQHANG